MRVWLWVCVEKNGGVRVLACAYVRARMRACVCARVGGGCEVAPFPTEPARKPKRASAGGGPPGAVGVDRTDMPGPEPEAAPCTVQLCSCPVGK